MSELFCCYSLKTRDYLAARGVRYELCALNPNNSHMFWVYIRNEKLEEILTELNGPKDTPR